MIWAILLRNVCMNINGILKYGNLKNCYFTGFSPRGILKLRAQTLFYIFESAAE